MSASNEPVLDTDLSFRRTWRPDALAGFQVFLIALPLCLGISMASGFPPFAGVLTAIVGGLLVSLLGSAPLTIKGPAAGLIVIVLGAVESLGGGDPVRGYKLALAVVVVAGLIQMGLGLLRAGKLGDLAPSSAVHGMLAAIGIIIAAKQVHVLLGASPAAKSSFGLIAELPHSVRVANPEIALIGLVSLLILFVWPKLPGKLPKKVPGALVVLLLAIPASVLCGLARQHMVHVPHLGDYTVGPKFLITVPDHLLEVITFPDFGAVGTALFWKWVVFFTLVGSLESLLSAKAIDALDPYPRTYDLDRDMLATGAGNVVAGLLGGLPMISEIVRSSANVNNGARTRWANFFHGVSLLLFIGLVPTLVHLIPLAALAAMLVHTGFRLASPKELKHAWALGREQLLVFVVTIVATLMTDLLVGMGIGIATELLCLRLHGVPFADLFRARVRRVEEDGRITLVVEGAAVFCNYLGLRRALAAVPKDTPLTVDLSRARLVDHTVIEHLHAEGIERRQRGGALTLHGLDALRPRTKHPFSARIGTAVAPAPAPAPRVEA